jgi:hypothetical protein
VRFYRDGLAATLSSLALPYGYAITVWSSGAFVQRASPPPTAADIFLFILGAVAAYAALRVVIGEIEVSSSGMGRNHMLRAGVIHMTGLFGAAAVAYLVARLAPPAVWALTPLCSTLTYLMIVACEQAFEVREQGPASS